MPRDKHLLLVGGGHAHAEVLRQLALRPPAGSALTLISPTRYTPYSGMLPGLLAGHYDWRTCHIDLSALCRHAGMDFHLTAASAIDAQRRQVTCVDGSVHDYDLLSLDVGSTPAVAAIAGAQTVGIRVKPVDEFVRRMQHLAERAEQGTAARIVVVGAGAAGIEISLALAYRLRHTRSTIELLAGAGGLLPQGGAIARRLLHGALRVAGVRLRTRAQVAEADAEGLRLRDGERVPADEVVWATGASAPPWLQGSGLALTPDGFIEVDAHLRSTSHTTVFAAGDVATRRDAPHPKAGVYAVRQGPVLAENLLRAMSDAPLLEYRPQSVALALLATGPRHAVALWGPLAWSGEWVWRWKDRIDRGFMRRYALDSGSGALSQ